MPGVEGLGSLDSLFPKRNVLEKEKNVSLGQAGPVREEGAGVHYLSTSRCAARGCLRRLLQRGQPRLAGVESGGFSLSRGRFAYRGYRNLAAVSNCPEAIDLPERGITGENRGPTHRRGRAQRESAVGNHRQLVVNWGRKPGSTQPVAELARSRAQGKAN